MIKNLLVITFILFMNSNLFCAQPGQIQIKSEVKEHYVSFTKKSQNENLSVDKIEFENLYTKNKFWVFSALITKPNEQPITIQGPKAKELFDNILKEYNSLPFEQYVDNTGCLIRSKFLIS